jgi:uncharacterized protein DUF2634
MSEIEDDELGFETLPLVPADDDDEVTPDDDIEAAAASALAAAEGLDDAADDAPEPYGMTWQFDPRTGRFVRHGGAPAVVTGRDSLIVWAMTALHTRAYAHPAVDGGFGVEGLNESVGKVATAEHEADLEEAIHEALMQHDRVSDVTDIRVSIERDDADGSGLIYIENFTMVTDEGEHVAVGGFTLLPEGL